MKNLESKLLVMASGSGTTFEALATAFAASPIQIVGLIASRSGIGAISRAEKLSIPYRVPKDDELIATAQSFSPNLIVLAGYLKKLPGDFIRQFPNKIINVHPSLLPKHGGQGMYGRHVHKAVYEAKDIETGASVHYVTEHYDEGPLIAQKKIPLSPDDTPETIESKVKTIEKSLLIQTIQKILE